MSTAARHVHSECYHRSTLLLPATAGSTCIRTRTWYVRVLLYQVLLLILIGTTLSGIVCDFAIITLFIRMQTASMHIIRPERAVLPVLDSCLSVYTWYQVPWYMSCVYLRTYIINSDVNSSQDNNGLHCCCRCVCS